MTKRVQTTEQTDGDLLTVQEVADLLRVDQTTVRRWIASGVFPAITLPRRGSRKVFRVSRGTVRHLLNGDVYAQ